MKSTKQTKSATKTGKPETGAPALPEKPAHTIELNPTEDRGVFTAKIGNKRAVVCFTTRDRSSADKQFVSVTISPARIKAASAAAKRDSLPVVVGVVVTVKGRWGHGWLVPLETYRKQASSQTDFSLGTAARTAYVADKDSLNGVKFVIAPKAKAA